MKKPWFFQGFRAKYLFCRPNMAGVAGFEPTNDGVRVRCLTAWRHPNMNLFLLALFYQTFSFLASVFKALF